MGELAGLKVLLGVCGGIAAYKAAELVRRLGEAGAQVRVVMTAGALEFIQPLTFQALSGNPVRSALWDANAEAAMSHIELARWADLVLIAPASANAIARLAGGLADDLLTTVCLACAAPLAVAPSMNQQMWANPATAENIERLRKRGVAILGPSSGDQACGDVGPGRLMEPSELIAALASMQVPGVLAGRRVLVSAGPTHEDLDPVRFLGNRSSGRMGFALASAAAAAGAEVILVAGPVHLPTPARVTRIDVRSARQMHAAVLGQAPDIDVYVGAAAVADFRPQQRADGKIKKSAANVSLALEPTEDIIAAVAALPRRPFVVGFAAETQDLEAYAKDKLERKRMDLIAANLVGQSGIGFDSDDNELLLLGEGLRLNLGRAPKTELAARLIREIAARLPAAVSKPVRAR